MDQWVPDDLALDGVGPVAGLGVPMPAVDSPMPAVDSPMPAVPVSGLGEAYGPPEPAPEVEAAAVQRASSLGPRPLLTQRPAAPIEAPDFAAMGNAAAQSGVQATGAAAAGVPMIAGGALRGAGQALATGPAQIIDLYDRVEAAEAGQGEMPVGALARGYSMLGPADREAARARLGQAQRHRDETGMGQGLQAAGASLQGAGRAVFEAADEFARDTFPVAPEREGDFGVRTARAVGALPPALAAGAVAGPFGMAGFIGSSAYSNTFNEARQTLLQAGASEEDADRRAADAATVNAFTQAGLMTVPFVRMLDRLGPQVQSGFLTTLRQMAQSGVEFSGSNAIGRIAENFLAQHGYDPDREITREVWESLGPEAVAGMAIPGGGAAVRAAGRAMPRATASEGVRGAAADIRESFTVAGQRPEPEARAAAEAAVERFAREVGLPDNVRVRLVDRLATPDGGEADGRFDPTSRLIEIAIDTDPALAASRVFHEGAGHAALSLLPGRERGALERAADRWLAQPLDAEGLRPGADADAALLAGARTNRDYIAGLNGIDMATPEGRLVAREEAIAHLAERHLARSLQEQPLVTRALDRVVDTVERLGNVFRGHGFNSAESVFRAMTGGRADRIGLGDPAQRVVDRPAGDGADGARSSVRERVWHGTPHVFAPERSVRLEDGTTVRVRAGERMDPAVDVAVREGRAEVREHPLGRFDYARIGSGEGNQAYGHGLYFAQNRGVAEDYRRNLAGGASHVPGAVSWFLKDFRNHLDRVGAARAGDAPPWNRQEFVRWARSDEAAANFPRTAEDLNRLALDPQAGPALDRLLRGMQDRVVEGGDSEGWSDADLRDFRTIQEWARANDQKPGALYEVGLDVDQGRLLDWDQPAEAQPPAVRDALGDLGVLGDPRVPANADGRRLYLEAAQRANAQAGRALVAREGAAGASAALRERGVQGVRYLDAGSRRAGDGTRNFVTFSDDVVEILGRYSRRERRAPIEGVATVDAGDWRPAGRDLKERRAEARAFLEALREEVNARGGIPSDALDGARVMISARSPQKVVSHLGDDGMRVLAALPDVIAHGSIGQATEGRGNVRRAVHLVANVRAGDVVEPVRATILEMPNGQFFYDFGHLPAEVGGAPGAPESGRRPGRAEPGASATDSRLPSWKEGHGSAAPGAEGQGPIVPGRNMGTDGGEGKFSRREQPRLEAWHGTHAIFSPEEGAPLGRFRDDRIGSGEGAQVRGYGHYLAEARETAQDYRERGVRRHGLPRMEVPADAIGLDMLRLPDWPADRLEAAQAEIRQAAQGAMRAGLPVTRDYLMRNVGRDAEFLLRSESVGTQVRRPRQPRGALYRVDAGVDRADLLKLDRPVREQGRGVQDRLQPLLDEGGASWRDETDPASGHMTQRGVLRTPAGLEVGSVSQQWGGWGPWRDGRNLGETFGRREDAVAAVERAREREPVQGDAAYFRAGRTDVERSAALERLGVPGMRFDDQVSRGLAAGGTENFVMFRGEPLRILRRYSVRENQVAGLHSAVERAVQDLPQARGTARQMRSMIERTRGVKPEEVAWLGLDRWLDEQGDRSVTREEILDYVRANRLGLAEVIRGGAMDPEARSEAEVDFVSEAERLFTIQEGPVMEVDGTMRDGAWITPSQEPMPDGWRAVRWSELVPQEVRDVAYPDADEARMALQESLMERASGMRPDLLLRLTGRDVERGWSDEQMMDSGIVERWAADVVLPAIDVRQAPDGSGWMHVERRSGEDWSDGRRWRTEVDARDSLDEFAWEVAMDEVRSLPHEQIADRLGIELPVRRVGSEPTKYETYQEPGGRDYGEVVITLPERGGGEDFTGSHWPEANVLAHARWNERTDDAGRPVLFIEEIQSDWHQAGRKRGMRQKVPPGALAAAEADVARAHADINALVEAEQRVPDEMGQALVRAYFVRDAAKWGHDPAAAAAAFDQAVAASAEREAAHQAWQEAKKAREEVAIAVQQADPAARALFDQVQALGEQVDNLQADHDRLERLVRGSDRAAAAAALPEYRLVGHEFDRASREYHALREQWLVAARDARARSPEVEAAQNAEGDAEVAFERARLMARAAEEETGRFRRQPEGVPDAPFKTSWPMLAFKRLLAMAVERDSAAIAWTTGQMQAGRYQQGAMAEEVRWNPQTGEVRFPGSATDGDVRQARSEAELRRAVGPDLAARLIEAEPDGGGERSVAMTSGGTLNRGIRAGGSATGMGFFYDARLPQEIEKLVRPFGGRVTSTRINTNPPGAPPGWETVYSVVITPELRRVVAGEGLPMFSRRERPGDGARPVPARQAPQRPRLGPVRQDDRDREGYASGGQVQGDAGGLDEFMAMAESTGWFRGGMQKIRAQMGGRRPSSAPRRYADGGEVGDAIAPAQPGPGAVPMPDAGSMSQNAAPSDAGNAGMPQPVAGLGMPAGPAAAAAPAVPAAPAVAGIGASVAPQPNLGSGAADPETRGALQGLQMWQAAAGAVG